MEKELKDISWLVTEEEYRKDPAYSYSTIARFNREGFDKLDKLFDKVESPSLTFGSIVDTLLTDGEEEFNNRFVVAELPEMSDTLVQIAKTLFAQYGSKINDLNNLTDDIIATVGEECGYYKGSKYKSYRIKMIRENCSEYYRLLFTIGNKTLITTKEYTDASDCVNLLKTSDNTAEFFNNNPFDKDTVNYYQLKFKGEYEGINLRCMADVIRVDYKNKVITPIDLKTSYKSEWNFHKSFIEWCYKYLVL